jgi:hypothetical protein
MGGHLEGEGVGCERVKSKVGGLKVGGSKVGRPEAGGRSEGGKSRASSGSKAS